MSIDSYLSGQPTHIAFALQDESGNPIAATAVDYRVLDQLGNAVIARTSLTYTPSAPSVTIDVTGAQNTLNTAVPAFNASGDTVTSDKFSGTVGNVREVRVIELFVTTAVGQIKLEKTYIIEANDVLLEGINSFQGYPLALMVSQDIPNIPGWSGASKRERVSALIRARQDIGQLRFRYVFDAYQNIVDNTLGIEDITLATPATFNTLPVQFVEALRRAQILQADFILGGDEISEIRKSGLLSITVGEAKQFFRDVKPIDGPVSRRVMKELTKWILTRKRIART